MIKKDRIKVTFDKFLVRHIRERHRGRLILIFVVFIFIDSDPLLRVAVDRCCGTLPSFEAFFPLVVIRSWKKGCGACFNDGSVELAH